MLLPPSRPSFPSPSFPIPRAAFFSTLSSPTVAATIPLSPTLASSSASSNTSSSATSATPPLDDPLPQRSVSTWLFLVAGLVFSMVVIGGLTRLTRSGLSMTEWRPTSLIPPLTPSAWQAEYAKWQLTPDYRERVERRGEVSMAEFQFIYLMEFAHRQLGRVVGLVFVGGLVWHGVRGRLNGPLLRRLALLGVAGGTQGAVGWWMVKSGLDQPHTTPHGVHVSPYRLAVHLLSAFAIYTVLLTTALQLRFPHTSTLVQLYNSSPSLQRLRVAAIATTCLTALTISSGAFVAGNEAGLVYNQFPLMGTSLIPTDLLSPYIRGWRNAFEHATLVQFEHRLLAVSTLVAVTGLWVMGRRVGRVGGLLTLGMRRAGDATLVMAWTQVALGISTLLLYVPVPLASAHQCGSLLLLTLLLTFVHTLGGRRVTRLTLHTQRQLMQAAQSGLKAHA